MAGDRPLETGICFPHTTKTAATVGSSPIGNAYTYTGRQLDGETGLYYYRARHYSSTLRRFLQADPIGYVDGPNVFTYVRSRPISTVDPSGELGESREVWVKQQEDEAADAINECAAIIGTARNDGSDASAALALAEEKKEEKEKHLTGRRDPADLQRRITIGELQDKIDALKARIRFANDVIWNFSQLECQWIDRMVWLWGQEGPKTPSSPKDPKKKKDEGPPPSNPKKGGGAPGPSIPGPITPGGGTPGGGHLATAGGSSEGGELRGTIGGTGGDEPPTTKTVPVAHHATTSICLSMYDSSGAQRAGYSSSVVIRGEDTLIVSH